ncbi:MAG: DNA polymerase III subunit epsilon [Bacteroidetes bacterium]|nr:DNA polymerase III subunit epsilon [Bacteroidota bacterium]
MQYAVVDVETSGQSNKITEIAVYVYDDEQREIVDTFSSLVNPECNIPVFISNLTGITDDMVRSAPRFFEIAKEVFTITENRVFVAHSVGFDYNVIRNEFRELGADFRRKKMCTVRLSRKVFPGLKSYSLGNLCESLGVEITDRHRATGDAKATTRLLELILDHDLDNSVGNALNVKSREASLPPNLPANVFHELPEQTGVYYMHDEEGKVIYVGKAINIKSRIEGHFADTSIRKWKFKDQIYDISYMLTGSELLALLVESAEIKKWFPTYNRAQKYTGSGYTLCRYRDQNDVERLEVIKQQKAVGSPLAAFSNPTKGREFLRRLCDEFSLCARMTGLQNTQGSCFDYHLGKCKGVCAGEESQQDYNNRVEEAIASFALEFGNYLFWIKGRNRDEKAFVLIENGRYKGYGFVDTLTQISSFEDITDLLVHQNHNPDIQHILHGYLTKLSSQDIVRFDKISV